MNKTMVFVALALVLIVGGLLLSASSSDATDGKRECRQACYDAYYACDDGCNGNEQCRYRCVDIEIACV